MGKVVLTKEQAEALNSALEVQGSSKEEVVSWHAKELWDSKRNVLNKLPLDTVIRALYVGYELEKSPEERVREFFIHPFEDKNTAYGNLVDVRKTIIITLDLLGVKVPGVNC